MVSIKEATANAIAFASNALGPERTAGIRLEEVESTGDGQGAWLITLSMFSPDGPMPLPFETGKRDYKSFTVRKSDGEVVTMKIREFAEI